jgi:hypothetical protein
MPTGWIVLLTILGLIVATAIVLPLVTILLALAALAPLGIGLFLAKKLLFKSNNNKVN